MSVRFTFRTAAAAWLRTVAIIVFVALSTQPRAAHGQDARSGYLIKLLQGSTQFRVRAQAAISLGGIGGSDTVVLALAGALRDAHPAVRAAAATSLGRVGNSGVAGALRALEGDREEPVRAAARTALARLEAQARPEPALSPVAPAGPPLYYLAVAEPASRVPSVDARSLADARAFIKQKVAQLQGVVLAPEGERSDEADKVLKKRKLKGFYLDSAVTSVEKKPDGGTRVAVSVIVATYPGRDMRAIMQGAATVSGSGPQDYGQALQAAFTGALRQLPQAMGR